MDRLLNSKIRLAEEVAAALEMGWPVVALESCMWSYGLPRPLNYEVACSTMSAIRKYGAVPAVVAVVEGQCVVGINERELRYICNSNSVSKASLGDLPGVMVAGRWAATTVSASLLLAEKMGIQVLATGGIGGVHPGWREFLDVSADMRQLARTRMAVVCSGVETVFDVTATLEMLETLGIPVATYQSDEFPRFCTSGVKVNTGVRLETVEQLAAFYRNSLNLLERGVLIANPVPTHNQVPCDVLKDLLERGLKASAGENRGGKVLTPYLLDFMARESKGATLDANKALLINNARLAAKVALHLAKEAARGNI